MRTLYVALAFVIVTATSDAWAKKDACEDHLIHAAGASVAATSAPAPVLDPREFANRLRRSGEGTLVTPVFNGRRPKAPEPARAYLAEILARLGERAIAAANVHVVINIYSSVVPNAFATIDTRTNRHPYLGVADDGRPIYEIGIQQAMFALCRSEDELAFVIGHELTHIINEDLSPSGDRSSRGTWVESQEREVEADCGALDLMRGHYDLGAGYDILERLLASGEVRDVSFWHALSSHHHPSLRLAMVLARNTRDRRTLEIAAPRPVTPLRYKIGAIKRSPRPDAPIIDSAEYLAEAQRWYRDILAPRAEARDLSEPISEERYPGLVGKGLSPDGLNVLIPRVMADIDALPIEPAAKIARTFEVLAVLSFEVRVAGAGSYSPKAAHEFLSPTTVRAIEMTLRRASFGAGNAWSASSVQRELDARLMYHQSTFSGIRFDRRRLVADEIMQILTREKQTARMFENFARVSPRWRDILNPRLELDPDDSVDHLQSTLVRAFIYGVTPAAMRALTVQIEAYPLDARMSDPAALRRLRSVFEYAGTHKTAAPELEPVVRAWLKRHESAYLARVWAELDRLTAVEPVTIPPDERGGHVKRVYDMVQLLVNWDDRPDSAATERLHRWVERVRRDIADQKLDYFSPLTLYVQALRTPFIDPAAGTRAERVATLPRRLFQRIRAPWLDQFASELGAAEVVSIIEDLTQSPLNDRVVADVAATLARPAERVAALGLTWDLLDEAVREGRPEEDVRLEWERHPHVKFGIDKLTSALSRDDFRVSAILGHRATKQILMNELGLDHLERIITWMSAAAEALAVARELRRADLRKPTDTPNAVSAAMDALLAVLLRHADEPFDRWIDIYRKLVRLGNLTPELMPLATRQAVAAVVEAGVRASSPVRRGELVRQVEVLRLLPIELAAEILADQVTASAAGRSLGERAAIYADLRKDLKLATNLPDLDVLLRRLLAERLRVQPHEIELMFPIDPDSKHRGVWIRGMSGLIAAVQERKPAEQMDLLDYVTGRTDVVPSFLSQGAETDADARLATDGLVALLRTRLARATNLERALALLPFFTGDRALPARPGGNDFLLDRILAAIAPGRRAFAQMLARGMLAAEGRDQAMAFALILGLRGESGRPLDEGEVLRAICAYGYGTPGVKFAQYLAHTTEFREVLGPLQDQALPYTHFDAIKRLRDLFGVKWSGWLEVISVKGSGSVNVGVEVKNQVAGTNEILSVPRENVAIATAEDFRRLRSALVEINKDPEGHRMFGFTLGLLRTIHDSVALEFDRPRVFDVHQRIARVMDHTVNGWRVKMVEPTQLFDNGVIRMQMATGTPARLVGAKAYAAAMGAASRAIFDHLLRRRRAPEFFADPDFHDGQAFVDEQSKTVWLIDPGQAVAIDSTEYKLALSIARILARAIDVGKATAELNGSRVNPRPGTTMFTHEEIAAVMGRSDRNDAFVRLIALTDEKGGHVPLPVVQWVFGVNRQLALGQRVGLALPRDLWGVFMRRSLTDFVTRPGLTNARDVWAVARAFWTR